MVDARKMKILRARLRGDSLAAIGQKVALSRMGVSLILEKLFEEYPEYRTDVRRALAKIKTAKVRARQKKNAPKLAIRKKYGRAGNRMIFSTCRGCKRKFNAREMRSHKCKPGWPWYKRVGKSWKYVQKRK